VRNGRKRVAAAVAGLGLACTLGMTATTPAEAQPNVKDVQARVDSLYKDADQATENYNEARLRLTALKQELASLRADQERQDTALSSIREQLRDSMLQQFEGSNLSAVGQVFISDDPKVFLGQLSTISDFDSLQAGLYRDYATQLDALRLRRKATEQRAADVAATEKKLAADKKAVDGKLAQAKDLLSKLKEKERQAVLSRDSSDRMPVDVPASGRAGAAIAYAKAQLGDAYVWGATGPNAFDCSGLTMMAWAAAGVSLPHSSRAQYSSGAHVSESDLQPGDLVFYYSPISHVGIYIGGGMVLHAANPSAGVEISPLHSMPYSGAVRPG
jgi:peptidoglycan DL-endopeptidase CwlO